MVVYPNQERDDDMVDPEHRDDKFEDVGKELDRLNLLLYWSHHELTIPTQKLSQST